ncbi:MULTISPECIES: potassium-transporting ATPase subunit C [unclassified Saccharopolyspora]|uniref:potassium-transporting ATPase subunit C n=1 Tax=unclassified Saccharopolyspora TaxID=2646250 RepID=UPI001CD5F3FB|nr:MULTISPECIES: potassium-transporting ATPase subunit C [unclassified Saccharopolyspora]MCA1187761.1 potassium-transporting ATPase subunit C [Saccharopolyspora sp. 6T]MCA1227288.1 potassium-transporting ATPase subunit C [Saccharopolyspora sp. 6M]MCA1279826.1 potassium-transporting ATPase subunit C [Saccharopolyspora sp. 7B]
MFTTLVRQAGTAVRALLVFTVLLGVCYPLAVWGAGHLPGLHDHAEGSPQVVDGRVVGSELIGIDPVPADPAHDPYFHTRPSASADGPLGPGDPSTSGGSSLAADNPELLAAVQQRRTGIAAREAVAPQLVPADAVTASASGVDAGISPAYAALQAPRVARETGLPVEEVHRLIAAATSGGVFAERTVAVPALNAAVAEHRG